MKWKLVQTKESQKLPAAILFDLEGTLVGSLPNLAGFLGTLFTQQGWELLCLADVKAMVGGGVPKLIERALRARRIEADSSRRKELAEYFLEIYGKRANATLPGVREVLKQLRDARIRLGVCTNKPEAITWQILDALSISPFLGVVIGGDTLPTKKPDEAPVLAALKIL